MMLACDGGSSGTTEYARGETDAAVEVAKVICWVLDRSKTPCAAEGTSVSAFDSVLDISVEPVSDVSFSGSSVMELEVAVALDGKPAPELNTIIVGRGNSRAEAHKNAANNWGSVYGAAILDRLQHNGKLTALQALQDEQDAPAAFVIGDWVAYPGWTNLQGSRSEASVIDIDGVLSTLASSFDWSPNPGTTHSALVQFRRNGALNAEPECRRDGVPDPALCERAFTYAWPNGNYIMKQYFVLTPGPLPGSLPPSE